MPGYQQQQQQQQQQKTLPPPHQETQQQQEQQRQPSQSTLPQQAPPPGRRPHLYLTYSVFYGLSNQLYSHINGLMLGWALGVDGIIMPPALSRNSFNHSFDRLGDASMWALEPLATLLDVQRMAAAWWQLHGIALQEVRWWDFRPPHGDRRGGGRG